MLPGDVDGLAANPKGSWELAVDTPLTSLLAIARLRSKTGWDQPDKLIGRILRTLFETQTPPTLECILTFSSFFPIPMASHDPGHEYSLVGQQKTASQDCTLRHDHRRMETREFHPIMIYREVPLAVLPHSLRLVDRIPDY